jgi:GT2 family glycosyltransferase
MTPTRPDISVCIVNWNTREYLDGCLRSLQEIPDKATREVIVVDNASNDASAEMVRDQHPLAVSSSSC